MLISSLMRRLRPDVAIDVGPSTFVFRCEGREERLAPVIWIGAEGRRRRLLAVGKTKGLTQPNRRVTFYPSEWNADSGSEQAEFLEAFCIYGIRRVLRRSFARPTAIVTGLASFPSDRHGVICRMLKQALRRWVHDVVFEDLISDDRTRG